MVQVETKERIEVLTPGCKEKFKQWIAERKGVIVWRNINLSDPNAGDMFTPAHDPEGEPVAKPHWSRDNGETITDLSRFRFVKENKEVQRFKIALRIRGMKVECTDAATRKIRKRCDHWQDQYKTAPTYRFEPPPPLGFMDGPVEVVIEVPIFED